jgi:hypothetical protein
MAATPGPIRVFPGRVTERADVTRLLIALRKALVDDTVYEDLEAVLGEYAAPTPEEVAALTDRLRGVLQQLIEIVPHRVMPYPVEEMRLVMRLSSEEPPPQEAHGHLHRFALAILMVLDLVEGDGR